MALVVEHQDKETNHKKKKKKDDNDNDDYDEKNTIEMIRLSQCVMCGGGGGMHAPRCVLMV